MTNTATTASIHTPGAEVVGTYYGETFAGTVIESRAHTINFETFIVLVKLDGPTVIMGQERTEVMLSVHFDGSNADSYIGVGSGHSLRLAVRPSELECSTCGRTTYWCQGHR